MNSQEELKCNQCLEIFREEKKPLKMTSCNHNLCIPCFQQIKKLEISLVECQFCSSSAALHQILNLQINEDILLKIVKKTNENETKNDNHNLNKLNKHQSSQSSDLLLPQQQILLDKKTSYKLNKLQTGVCQIHQKPLQIICITDLKTICSYCAIFGQHKDHKFKTLKQLNEDYELSYERLQKVKQQKYILDKKHKTSSSKQSIEQKISKKKQQIKEQVSKNLQKIVKAIELLQTKVCEELNKTCNMLFQDIAKIFDQETKFDEQYNKWQNQYQDLLNQVSKDDDINRKVKLFYTNLPHIELGQQLVNKIERRNNLQMKKVETYINSVNINVVEQYDFSKFIKISKKEEDFKSFNILNMIQKINFPSGMHILEDVDNFSQNSFIYENKHDISLKIPGEKRNASKSITFKKSSIARNQLASPKCNSKFTSPNRKQTRESESIINRVKSNTDLTMNSIIQGKSFDSITQSRLKMQPRQVEAIIQQFIKQDLKQVLDFSRCELNDESLITNLKRVRKQRKIRVLKLCQNYITDKGFQNILEYLDYTTNLNISYNKLTEQSLSTIIRNREKLLPLRIVNFSFNNLAQRKCKAKVDTLKKMGIIVNI